MTKAQWKAIYDYCKENGYAKPYELLSELKSVNAVDRQASVEDLGDYADGYNYEGMMDFLKEALE